MVAGTRAVTVRTRTAEETRELGRMLGRAAKPLPPSGLVVGLRGVLGAGKTVFVQGIARGLGVPDAVPVVSPTFTIARDYVVPGPPRVVLQHVDAYRLVGAAELEGAGFEEMWGEGRLTCVEWAERVEDAMPPDRLEVELTPDLEEAPAPGGDEVPDVPRRIRVRALGPAGAEVLERFSELAERRGAP